ncbi:MAG: 50S ribosomal protein L5 [Candidatus Paceibacterota bacterium]|jgi:large subunit ribosomal protein L5
MKQASLREKYQKEIKPELQKELGLKNVNASPVLEKVVVNVGLGRMGQNANFQEKVLPEIIKEVSQMFGQKPSPRPAKKSISGFKLREGQTVGIKVTLRGGRMYDVVDKIVKSVFPRVRDFRGINLKNIDEKGNLNLGFREHVVFPEIAQDISTVNFGLQITVVVRARKREHAIELYKKLGFLFKKEK